MLVAARFPETGLNRAADQAMMASLRYPAIYTSFHAVEIAMRRWPVHLLRTFVPMTVASFAFSASAAVSPESAYEAGREPPSLPGEERANPKGAVNVDAGNITIRDRAPHNTLGVRVDGYSAIRPSVAIENGWLLRSDLGIGGAYKFRNDYADLLFNAVFAPRRDVRIQMSVSQVRSGEGFAVPQSHDLITVLQTSYLASIKKVWDKSRVVPETGMSVFTSRAADPSKRDMATSQLEMGTLAGYMLNIAARPAYHSKVEFGYKSQSVAYDHPLIDVLREKQSVRSIDYSRLFDDCSRINGRYSTGAGVNQINLQFERRGFTIALLQSRTASSTDNVIRVGYSQPLGSAGPRHASCSGKPIAPTSLQALVDSTISRSPFLPSEPVARFAALKASSLH
jgi:hypothetical protein